MKFIIGFFLLFPITSCTPVSYKVSLVHSVSSKYKAILSKENIAVVATGGAMMDEIKSFFFQKKKSLSKV